MPLAPTEPVKGSGGQELCGILCLTRMYEDVPLLEHAGSVLHSLYFVASVAVLSSEML